MNFSCADLLSRPLADRCADAWSRPLTSSQNRTHAGELKDKASETPPSAGGQPQGRANEPRNDTLGALPAADGQSRIAKSCDDAFCAQTSGRFQDNLSKPREVPPPCGGKALSLERHDSTSSHGSERRDITNSRGVATMSTVAVPCYGGLNTSAAPDVNSSACSAGASARVGGAGRRFEADESPELARRLALKVVDNPDAGLANVIFTVGGHRFGGIREMLSLFSDVIDSMLRGTFKEGRSGTVIPLPQFSHAPMAFREFLIFAHSGRASLAGAVEVAALYEICEYFNVTGLQASCLDFLDAAEVQNSNASYLLGFAERHDLAGLRHRLCTFIKANAEAALADPRAARHLPAQLLREIFCSDAAGVSELALFRVLKELDPDLQQELGPLIRLPLIPAADIMSVVLPSGLIGKDACLEALAYQADPESVALPPVNTRNRSHLEEVRLESRLPSPEATEPSGTLRLRFQQNDRPLFNAIGNAMAAVSAHRAAAPSGTLGASVPSGGYAKDTKVVRFEAAP